MSFTELVRYNAVQVTQVVKSYGRGKSRTIVLNGINMTVPSGSIYGLLGPSGCGKTTLLRCIVGRLNIDDGDLITLRKPPGTVGHNVPGKLVGYMPQELALYDKFTVEETLNYFGRVNGMTSGAIERRTAFLIQFLNLPEKERLISQLSGGQQRRTSFAIALLHEPDILILDEPTVGVDPVLRLKIWDHLTTISRTSHTTVIITTHYIEEARQAHMVGLMRNGCLLAEATPASLLAKYRKLSLEDVFLHLCEEDNSNENGAIEGNSSHIVANNHLDSTSVVVRQANETSPLLLSHRGRPPSPKPSWSRDMTLCQKCRWFLPSFWNMIALFIKNMTLLKRQIGVLMFQFLLPPLQITLFCLCIGGEPRDLPMAVVNNETCSDVFFCGSARFLDNLNSHIIIQKNYSHRFDDAMKAAKAGSTVGIIDIGEHFTKDLLNRFTQNDTSNATLEGSTVHLYLDMTNQQISLTVQQDVLQAFENFVRQTLVEFHINPAIAEIPVKLEAAIYGDVHPSFTNFMAPGVMISIPFFLATGLTALSFVIERKQGLLDRSLVAGVSAVEIMIGHIATQFLVMLVQVALLLAIALVAFKIPSEGSLLLVIILTLLQGLTGMALGFLISSLCEEETSAIQFALGSVYPNLLLSGIIWPLQSMPVWLQYISYCLPMTLAGESMRSILSRGWGLSYVQVWSGFVVSIGWGGVLMAASAIAIVFRRF